MLTPPSTTGADLDHRSTTMDDVDHLARAIDQAGIVSVDGEIADLARSVAPLAVSSVLTAVIADHDAPDVARARAFGLLASQLNGLLAA